MAQQDYCAYLINKINECDVELMSLAKANIPIANEPYTTLSLHGVNKSVYTVYYENYLILSRKNYVQLLAVNCNSQPINPKYFRKHQPIKITVPSSPNYSVAGMQKKNNQSLQPSQVQKTTTELRPVAKPFYPNNTVDTLVKCKCTTIANDTTLNNQVIVQPPNLPPPLEDCDDSPIDYQKPAGQYFIDYLLFNDIRCCHGIYCPGYNGFYECPFEET